MSQRDQVIEVMENQGGFATLGQLNQRVDCSSWETCTPYATIRRIVQNKKYFFRIRPGLWGLNTYQEKLGALLYENQSAEKREKLDHYYYQGLLLEIGNIQKYQTFAPNQDKNKTFLHTTLGETRELQQIHQFSYQNIVERACMIDVIWFNRRNMPYAVFEVEHSTDFTNALSKYVALQDFNTKFYIVSNQSRGREFKDKILRDEYRPIKERVGFIDYDKLATWHGQSMQTNRLGQMP